MKLALKVIDSLGRAQRNSSKLLLFHMRNELLCAPEAEQTVMTFQKVCLLVHVTTISLLLYNIM
jgi:hypothetical protein